jgi:hypothetical protein
MDGLKKQPDMRRATRTRTHQFFLTEMGKKVDRETLKLIQSGQTIPDDKHIHVRKKINSAGTTELINTATQQLVGVSKLDKNQLPDQIYMAIDQLRLAWATDAAITNPAAIKYTNKGDIPAALMNGEFVFYVNDKPIVDIPVCRFFNDGSTGVTSEAIQGKWDALDLQCLKFILPTDLLRAELKLAEGVQLPAGNHFVEFQFSGVGLRKN